MEYRKVPINLIRVGRRLRATSRDTVDMLAESIGEVGLIHPIVVDEGRVGNPYDLQDGYWLVAGAHRLEACRSLGLTEIPVAVVPADASGLQHDLIEIDENLAGPKLTRAERALFLRNRKVIYEALHPETRQHVAGGHAKAGTATDTVSFAADTAAKTGVSERTVRRDARLGERIAADVMEAIAGTPFDNGRKLDALSRLPVEQQRKIASHIAAGEISSAEIAILMPLDEEKAIGREEREIVAAWAKARREARVRAAVKLDKRGELAKVGLKLTDII